MRWYFGYPVLAAGLVFGAQILFPRDLDELTLRPSALSQNPEEERSAVVSALARKHEVEARAPVSAKVVSASEVRAQPRSRVAAFSPGPRLLDAELPPPAPGMFDFIARSFAAAAPQPAAALTASVAPVTAGSWKSAVVQVKADIPVKTKPAGEAQKALLARDIQRELQRVGCYVGEIDGIWGAGSQRAVIAFMERVNAILPVDEPDVFMLSLLATESNAVCGTTCPHGQVLSAGGRCLPTTLLAHDDGLEPRLTRGPALASRPHRGASEAAAAQETDGAWETVVADATPANRPQPLYGRMGIGGPPPSDEIPPAARTHAATLPIGSNRLHRTASLTPPLSINVVDDAHAEAIRPVSDIVPEQRMADPIVTPRRQARERAAERPRAVKSSRKNWRSNYRQVQRLFEHPLGRM
ncbi:peptidoglycan-binding domain-containing protein [Hyphomicrobium sp.]|uniref:peptidoglycan-binding domain-containing protein n=1 Tax=Hyphomicrobium sp. TaxID=82 RepID=UPI002D05E3ED|nr:peptidoglycan-binding domain-containing protein [Hyphomicrobium sp.]HRN89168.1 peptidoglycan-binding domain-containing protein [Hyphomicrobium sp.]HRQ27916.1 peptidoglycan-binding domain-containing protein [Hyphomicrobium sp.]